MAGYIIIAIICWLSGFVTGAGIAAAATKKDQEHETEPVTHGRWVEYKVETGSKYIYCSSCGLVVKNNKIGIKPWRRCPDCGSYNREGDK